MWIFEFLFLNHDNNKIKENNDFRENLAKLKGFFLDKSEEELIDALNKYENIEDAINYLMENY